MKKSQNSVSKGRHVTPPIWIPGQSESRLHSSTSPKLCGPSMEASDKMPGGRAAPQSPRGGVPASVSSVTAARWSPGGPAALPSPRGRVSAGVSSVTAACWSPTEGLKNWAQAQRESTDEGSRTFKISQTPVSKVRRVTPIWIPGHYRRRRARTLKKSLTPLSKMRRVTRTWISGHYRRRL